MRESQKEGEVAPFPPARGGSGRKTAVAIPATTQPNSHDGRPRNPPPRLGPRRSRPAPGPLVPRHLPALNSGLRWPPQRLTSASREHPPPLPQPRRKRFPMPGGRRHSGALSSPGKPRRAPRSVHPPREPRASVSAGGGDRPARSPASSRGPRPVRPRARHAPRGVAHLPAHLPASRPPPPCRPAARPSSGPRCSGFGSRSRPGALRAA